MPPQSMVILAHVCFNSPFCRSVAQILESRLSFVYCGTRFNAISSRSIWLIRVGNVMAASRNMFLSNKTDQYANQYDVKYHNIQFFFCHMRESYVCVSDVRAPQPFTLPIYM